MSDICAFDAFHPGTGGIPVHVGLIPDGNRRWARRNRVALPQAYMLAVRKLVECVRFCYERDTRSVSLYLASTHNFGRDEREVTAFCTAGEAFCRDLLPPLAETFDARVKLAGRIELLPEFVRRPLRRVLDATERRRGRTLYLCAGYNPLEEVARAFEAASSSEDFLSHLWVPEPVDLVIRTSGVNLLSNFLPLQCGYARLHVLEKLFNDIDPADLAGIYEQFSRIERRYGE